jgi:DNA-binding transcriptional MerR regulator
VADGGETPRSTDGPRAGELRVEDLASAAGCSVDTIRFYQKRRLLAPPRRQGRIAWYGRDHVERLARIRDLQGQGLSLELIRRLLDDELDATDARLAVAVAAATDEELVTLDELARRAGVPEALLDAAAGAGLLVPQSRAADGEAARYAAGDAEIVRAGVRLLEAGLPLDALLALAGRQHEMTRAVAEEAVAMFDAHVRQPLLEADLTDEERAARIVDVFRTLLPTATALVAAHFRAVLLEVAREHLESVGDTVELRAAAAEPGWELAAAPVSAR